MFRKVFVYGGSLLVASALVFLMPAASQAAPGHGGGFHGGGAHVGGFHAGGFHGAGYAGQGFHTGAFHAGGYGRGFYNRGYYGGYSPYYGGLYGYGGLYPYSYGGLSPYNYGGYSYYGGYTPSYSTYYPSYSGYYPLTFGTSSLPYDTGSSPDYSLNLGSGSGYQPAASIAPARADTTARVTVRVPADAQVLFNDVLMTSTGAVREFSSPRLTPGQKYHYDVQAKWNENGREVTQTRQVAVSPGANVSVDFTAPATTSEQVKSGNSR
jgi:uncharacterized protein (TIGR03000 family)